MIRTLQKLVLTGGALLLPLFVCAHNGELLLAKLTLRTDGSCVLQVTADTEANFTIRNRAQLTEVANSFFLVSAGKDTTPLAKVAGDPSFFSETKLDPSAPLGHTPEELAKSYKLEAAEWTWTPESPKFVLRVPEMSPHTLILWLVDEKKPTAKPRWIMMVAEDESPLIVAAEPARRDVPWWLSKEDAKFIFIVAATVAGIILVWIALGLNRIGEWLDRKPKR